MVDPGSGKARRMLRKVPRRQGSRRGRWAEPGKHGVKNVAIQVWGKVHVDVDEA